MNSLFKLNLVIVTNLEKSFLEYNIFLVQKRNNIILIFLERRIRISIEMSNK